MTKALPKEEAFFRYRGTEAEEVEPYALSKERQEESRNEIEEVTQERRAAGETLDALEGEPAPKPHNKRCQVEDCKHPQFLQSTVGIGAQEERWIFPW